MLAAAMFDADGEDGLVRFWNWFHATDRVNAGEATAASLAPLLTTEVSRTLGRGPRLALEPGAGSRARTHPWPIRAGGVYSLGFAATVLTCRSTRRSGTSHISATPTYTARPIQRSANEIPIPRQ